MNIHQHQFSDSKTSNINIIGGISEGVNHIENEKLNGFMLKVPEGINIIGFATDAKNIICLKPEGEEQVMYALCRKPDGTTRLLNTLELRKLNTFTSTLDTSKQFQQITIPSKNKSAINQSINTQKNKFSDGKYTYTSNRGQKFDVTIENKQATEIKPHGSILLGSNVGAIKRCITLGFDKNFQKYGELDQSKSNVIENYTHHVSSNITTIYNANVLDDKPLEKETASHFEIEQTVVSTVYKCEKLLTDDLNQYSGLLKTINHKLFSYSNYNDLNNEILEQLCIGLFIFSKKAGFNINQLKDILDNTIIFQNYRVSLIKNIEMNNFSFEFMQDILSFLNKAEKIIANTEEIKNPVDKYDDIGDDIFSNNTQEEISNDEIMKDALDAIKRNGSNTYSGKTEPDVRL